MTCKDCYHYEICGGFSPSDLDEDVWDLCAKGKSDEIPDIEDRCSEFKDKSLIIELPCNVGDTVYFVYGGLINPHKIRRFEVSGYGNFAFSSLMFTFDDFGKTVFLTREEAEKALAERSVPSD